MKIWKLAIVVLAVGMFSVSSFGQDCSATCDGAPVATVGTTYTCDTNPGTYGGGGFGPLGDCQDEYGNPGSFAVGGQWLQVVGTGNTMTATTCDPEGANVDSMMLVICGGCDAPFCAGASEDFCGAYGYSGEVTWCSEAGEVYWIGVGDNYTPQDVVMITVSDDGAACAEPAVCGAVCGNGVIEATEDCDGDLDAFCPGECDPVTCLCPEEVPMPALPPLGIVGLGALLLGGGAVVFARKRKS